MSDPVPVSVVVPVYNSEGSLPLLAEALAKQFEGEGRVYELVLINDCSRDQSWEVIERLAGENPERVRGVDLMRNFGQHSALLCGIRAARYPLVVTMDDDLQHPPDQLPELFAEMGRGGFDVVYGVPERQPHGLWRGLASRVTKLALSQAMGSDVAHRVSALRVFRTDLREAFANYQSPHVNLDVLLTWGTNRFGWKTVRHDPRTIGQSNYTFFKLMAHAINMATGFSTVPLRLASLVGFGFTLFGIGVLVVVIVRRLMQGDQAPVPGFAFLASAMAVFSGAQLFALGVIGEYLARIHFRTMDKPSYVVRQSRGGQAEA